MGFGKTTALREYLRARQQENIWLPLLGSGGSLPYFWSRLAAQIRKKNPDMGNRLDSLGFPGDAPKLAKIVGMISELTYHSPLVVVVDDYQLIDCPQAADLITLVSAERVPNLHIVLLARDTSALDVAGLRQRGLCLLIGQETLQFRPEEIREYFTLMEHPVDEKTLHFLSRWTGGWISGIYLQLHGLRQGLPLGRGEDIDQLLEANLYGTYDQDTRDFLHRLSVLDAFTPEQVAYVFESGEAASRLLALQQGNAFIGYYGTIEAYKMSDVLQEFLQRKAYQAGLDPKPIWRRMGMWFLERGDTLLAYDYLCRAGERELILRDLNRDRAKEVSVAQFFQIFNVLENLTAGDVRRYPLATLRYIRLKALSSPPSAREELELRLREMEEYFLDTADLSEKERTRILGEVHNTWIFVAFNDVHSVVAHAEKAVAYFNGRYSCIVSNSAEFTFGAPHLLYCYYNERGALRERAEFISRKFHILAQAVDGCGAGSEPLALAEYALETGDFDHVEINARKAVYQSRMYGQTSIEICAAFVLARLCLLRGEFAEGERLLTSLAEVVSHQDSSVLNTTVELCLAYINSCYGKVDAVPVWLRENNMAIGEFLFQGVAFPYIVCMRSVLLTGNFVRLEVLCQEFREKFAQYNNCLGFIHNDICLAIAREHLYGLEAGCVELERALLMAAEDGVVLPFGENAVGIQDMLTRLRDTTKAPPDFVKRVVDCCCRYHESVSGLLPTAVSITQREREILALLAQGLKHEDISARLFISVPTVRYHVKNVYQKLEVNNKVSAIQKARAMHFI